MFVHRITKQLIAAGRFYKCKLCKSLFGKSKACFRRERLRSINKIQAVSIWICRQLSVYNQWVCDACRKMIERDFVTDETTE